MYKITKSQLITCWIIGLILLGIDLFSVVSQPSTIYFFILFLIPGALIFYTQGWKKRMDDMLIRQNQKKNKKYNDLLGEFIETIQDKNHSKAKAQALADEIVKNPDKEWLSSWQVPRI